MHLALRAARPGDVLVAALHGSGDAGHWGGLMTRAALERGLGGLIIDGSIRDRPELRTLGFPVFFRSTCPRKARKRDAGSVGEPIRIGGVEIVTGDLVVADEDGVVVVPSSSVERVREQARVIALQEEAIEDGTASLGPV